MTLQETLHGLISDIPQASGYADTVREILQQPETWEQTAGLMAGERLRFSETLTGARSLVLTGSGSSEYAGLCAESPLQEVLGIPVRAIGGGTLLVEGCRALPAGPAVVVSLARSGNSPESTAVIERLADARHIVVTANPHGRLATGHARRAHVITLDERTCDRSLVMTSSFTNLALASHLLAPEPAGLVESLCRGARQVLAAAAVLAEIAARPFTRALYLGHGARFGAARESALKMLEMTAGRVSTMAETPLGLRHGPMSWIDEQTLIVLMLDSGKRARFYELDLLEELQRKKLGLARLVIGADVPARGGVVALEHSAAAEGGDDYAAIVDVVAGQLIALFRCLREGLEPDSPSASGIINRVVESFRIYEDTRSR